MSFLYTVVQANGTNLNKSFDKDGNKTSNALLSYGLFQVESVDNVRNLLHRFKNLQPNQAIIPAVPKNGSFNGIIGSRDINIPNSLTRTKEDFAFNGNNILCFDYDPDEFGYTINNPEHYVQVLRDIDTALVNCEIGVTYGSSYGIHNGDACINNKLSFHAYILVSNASNEKVKEYKESFKNLCWVKGYGHVKISKSGSLLQRQVFDEVVFSQERLLFEASPSLAENITQIKPNDYFTQETGARNLDEIPPSDGKGKLLFKESKESKKAEAKIIRDKYIDEKSDELAKVKNISKEVAVKAITRKVTDSVLTADDVLYSKTGIVKVSDIFLNPEQYKNFQVQDPIDPKPNEYIAMVYVNENSIIVHSFKSGGINYKLVANEEIINTLCNNVVTMGDVDNKKFASEITKLCDDAEISKEVRQQFALTLKSKKIVSNIKELNSKVMKIPFPDYRYVDGEIRLLNTIDNLDIFLKYMKIDVKYDEILKEGMIRVENDNSDFNKDTDDKINSQFIKIKSEAIKVGLPERIIEYLPALIDNNSVNPIMDMVKSKEWDGKDRVSEAISCLKSDDEGVYVTRIITLWFLQCIAAWDYIKSTPLENALARFESVLVFVGSQGLSKTKYLEGLIPKDLSKYVKAGVCLDVHDKDSIKIAICSAICELGELDSTFLRDIGALKAFMSLANDKFRLPYARSESNFRRRTSFCASVNDTSFLVDPTGNRRFQPIALIGIDYEKFMKIDKQQLWAQVYTMYLSGEKWWIDEYLDAELYAMLNKKHIEHMNVTAVEDIIEKVIRDTKGPANNFISDPLGLGMTPPPFPTDSNGLVYRTATEIANHYKIPSTKRGVIGKIKQSLLAAGIQNNGNTFNVRLVG
ncbi:MAG: VapE domain-containing protein [Sulfurimonas sp.]|jgi:hypothetical protein